MTRYRIKRNASGYWSVVRLEFPATALVFRTWDELISFYRDPIQWHRLKSK